MNSKMAEAIKLSSQPVAVFRSKQLPANAIQFRKNVWGCVVAMLNAASKGKTAAFNKETVACAGGRAGLGIQRFELGKIEYFLSVGGNGSKPGEFYKKSPELARNYVQTMPNVETDEYVIFSPLSKLQESETPEAVIFLVNADQLSGLATLANYDQKTQDNVKLLFGAGCVQAVLYGLVAAQKEESTCYIGLTDPSARKCIQKDILSFTIPFHRFLEMESHVEDCFFHTDTWKTIAKRI